MKSQRIENEEVKEMLAWVETLAKSSPSFRKKLKAQILAGIKEFDKDIHSQINSSNFELIGICPNITYYKMNGDEESLKSMWVHPFGTPSLLYHVKDSPCLLITNPSLRYNSNVLKEIDLNNYNEEVVGITS